MTPLDDLIKEAEELREYFRKNPGSGVEQSYWSTRLFTLKEARLVYELHLSGRRLNDESEQCGMDSDKRQHAKEEEVQNKKPKDQSALSAKKRTPEQKALRKMIMNPNMFVFDKTSKSRLMKNLKGKRGDDEDMDDGE